MKRYFSLILLGIVTLLLVGCMDVTQELWINADGSAKMSMDIGMSEEMANMGNTGGEEIPSNPTEDINKTFAGNPNIKNVETDEYTADKMKHWVIKFDIVDFEKFVKDSKKDKSFDMTLEKMDNGNYLLKQNIKMDEAAAGGEDVEGGEEMAQAMMSAFEGHYYTVIVHAPKVVKHNGKVDDKTKAVIWKTPMKDLMGGKKGEPIVASIEYSTAKGGFIDSLGIGGDIPTWVPYVVVGLCCLSLIVVVIIVVVVVVVMKKKKGQPA